MKKLIALLLLLGLLSGCTPAQTPAPTPVPHRTFLLPHFARTRSLCH